MIKEKLCPVEVNYFEPRDCADPENFVRGGPTSQRFFFISFNEGREDRNTTISGSSSLRQRNGI